MNGRASVLALAAIAALGIGVRSGFRPTTQMFGPFPYRVDTDRPVVALSFDDGPNEPYTSRLLDVLEERQVRATFFQVGRCAERYPETTRRVVEAGHVLGNHSYNHRFTGYLTEPRQVTEIERCQEVLTEIGGRVPALYRPPWLCHWPWVLSSIRQRDLQVVSGKFGHPFEVWQPDGDGMARWAAQHARPGEIIIFHDGFDARGGRRDQTVAAIGPLIDLLRERGYCFATVNELLGVPPYLDAIQPSTLYSRLAPSIIDAAME
jgi:peptidoglycan-N-acetylglucosamine deacetylase